MKAHPKPKSRTHNTPALQKNMLRAVLVAVVVTGRWDDVKVPLFVSRFS